MTPITEWLKPPRTLLVWLFLLTLFSVSAMSWFAWRLLEQERMVEAQRHQERMEQMADRVVATLRGTIAETGERLGVWQADLAPELPVTTGLILLMAGNTLEATPHSRLIYYPFTTSANEAPATVFQEAEMFEFAQSQPGEALAAYRTLADSPDEAVRAGALLRFARVSRSMNRPADAAAAYSRLATLGHARVAGVPASLVARVELSRMRNDRTAAAAVCYDLLHSKWMLTRGQFSFYWAEAERLAGRKIALPADASALSEAVARVWEHRARDTEPRGEQTLWVGGRPFFVLWRGTPERRAALLTSPEAFLTLTFAGKYVRFAAFDSDGNLVAGQRGEADRAVVRTAGESRLPWTLYLSAPASARANSLATQRRFLLLGLVVMTLFLMMGAYFALRAIRREAELLRMQSDFVSAVSHEFRSPLTTLRQLSEMLTLGRVPNEARRQLYYETMLSETTRLQRVVESLLNFGRMEAGKRQYRFEEVDACELVHRVAGEFERNGRSVIRNAHGAGCVIDADPEAIAVAVRNLLDNAVKYSPGEPSVWVDCRREESRVAIAVRDTGLGVADAEKDAIFQKFMRGSAASTSNVKGSGVGLAMVKHIVDAHGGQITLISRAGYGSTFTILLPAVEKT